MPETFSNRSPAVSIIPNDDPLSQFTAKHGADKELAKFYIYKPYQPPSPELVKARQEYVEILSRLGIGLEADTYMSLVNINEQAPMRIKAACVLDR